MTLAQGGYTGASPSNPSVIEAQRKFSSMLNNLRTAHVNTRGEVTLRANETTTVITFTQGQLSAGAQICLTPKTANAAGAVSSLYVSNLDADDNARTITLTHASSAATDKTFYYVLVG